MNFLNPLYDYFQSNWLELCATALTLVAVGLTVVQNVWNWPIGAVSVLLTGLVFFEKNLFADVGLQGFFFVMQFYGWYQWLHGGTGRDDLPVRRAPPRLLLVLVVLGAGSSPALGYTLNRFTTQEVAYFDSAIAVFSLIAQWLLARKYLENWLFWIVIDAVAVGVYAYKSLYVFTGLYALFLGMAAMGYVEWSKSLRGEGGRPAAVPPEEE